MNSTKVFGRNISNKNKVFVDHSFDSPNELVALVMLDE